jgi:hypothetical protein
MLMFSLDREAEIPINQRQRRPVILQALVIPYRARSILGVFVSLISRDEILLLERRPNPFRCYLLLQRLSPLLFWPIALAIQNSASHIKKQWRLDQKLLKTNVIPASATRMPTSLIIASCSILFENFSTVLVNVAETSSASTHIRCLLLTRVLIPSGS